jgi:hypothetical protein
VFKFDVMVVKFSVPVSVSKEQFKFSFESFSRRVIFDSLMFSMFWFSIKSLDSVIGLGVDVSAVSAVGLLSRLILLP